MSVRWTSALDKRRRKTRGICASCSQPTVKGRTKCKWHAEMDKVRVRQRRLATNPCPHLERDGRHEVYLKNGGMYCRACGAVWPKMTTTAMDKTSKPLRDAIQEWARERGCGWSGGWFQEHGYWCYTLDINQFRLVANVVEDGSKMSLVLWNMSTSTCVNYIKATNPRGVKRALTLSVKGCQT